MDISYSALAFEIFTPRWSGTLACSTVCYIRCMKDKHIKFSLYSDKIYSVSSIMVSARTEKGLSFWVWISWDRNGESKSPTCLRSTDLSNRRRRLLTTSGTQGGFLAPDSSKSRWYAKFRHSRHGTGINRVKDELASCHVIRQERLCTCFGFRRKAPGRKISFRQLG